MKYSTKILLIALAGTCTALLFNTLIIYFIAKTMAVNFGEVNQLHFASQLTSQILEILLPLVLGLFGVVSFFIVLIMRPIDHLIKIHAKLEEKIKEKTAELEEKVKETGRMNKFMLGRELKMIGMKKEIERIKKESNSGYTSSDVLHGETPVVEDSEIQAANSKKALLNIMEDLQIERDAAQREKAKDEAILASIGDGLVVTDKEGRVLRMNQNAEQLLGLDHTTSIGRDFHDITALYDEHANPTQKEDRPITLSLSKGERVSKTLILVKPNDQKVSINITTSPIMQRDPLLNQDTIIGSIAIIRDITREREIDRMKTEFIALASHQLRTPLSAIKWFGEMLFSGDAGELNEQQKDFLKNMNDSTERTIALVNSLLNISRMESGRIIVDPQPTDMKELIDGAVKELQVKINERQQNLIISVHNDLPKINLDPKLIRQVYLNLLTNAIKYTPKGGEISVFVSKKDDKVISQVTDNGYGIPKAEQSKVFEKFFRATNVVKVETDGTGLGLYLIKAIIESSHGEIWFESEEGKGTTFWFSLPLSGMEAKKGEVTINS